MKRFLILGACIVLCSSLVARAEILQVTDTADMTSLGTINMTRTDMLDGRDQLLLTLATISGHAAGGGITIVEGTWTPSAGGIYVAKGKSTGTTSGTNKWGARTTVNGADLEAETSWVNLETMIGTLDPATGQYKTTPTPPLVGVETFNRSGQWNPTSTVLAWLAQDSTFLKGAWLTTGTPLSPTTPGFADLATLYVPHGAPLEQVMYAGKLGYTSHGGESFPVTIGIVIPEPSTLVLLGMGLMGLVCYAWRKRK